MEADKKIAFSGVEKYTIILLFALMVIILFIQVVLRFIFSFSFSWAEQLVRLMFVWITFAGVSLAAGKSMHLRVSIIASIFPKRVGPICLFISDVIATIFGFYMSYHIYNNMMFVMREGQTFASVPWLSVWIMYLAGCLGMLGFSLRIIQTSLFPTLKKFVKSSNEQSSLINKKIDEKG